MSWTVCASASDRLGLAVELHQQDRGRVGRVSGGVDRGLHRRDAGLVHHLERGGHDAGGDDRRHGLAGGPNGGEVGQHRADALGDRLQPHRDLGGDPEHPFAPDEQSHQIGPPRLALRRSRAG